MFSIRTSVFFWFSVIKQDLARNFSWTTFIILLSKNCKIFLFSVVKHFLFVLKTFLLYFHDL